MGRPFGFDVMADCGIEMDRQDGLIGDSFKERLDPLILL